MDGCCLIWVTSLALAIFGLVKSHKTLTCNHDEVIHSRSFPPFFFFGKGLVSLWIKNSPVLVIDYQFSFLNKGESNKTFPVRKRANRIYK